MGRRVYSSVETRLSITMLTTMRRSGTKSKNKGLKLPQVKGKDFSVQKRETQKLTSSAEEAEESSTTIISTSASFTGTAKASEK